VSLDNPVKVSRRGDGLLFVAIGGGGPWTVTFDKNVATVDPTNYPVAPGSPFANGNFTVSTGAPAHTGPVTNGAVGRTYRFNVRQGGPGGPITHDPDVDVES
jgi:hypothetical protein